MTLDEFLSELNKVADRVKWSNEEGKYLRATTNDGKTYCPLTLVVFTKTGRKINVFEAEKAGILLGLSRDDRWGLIMAADRSEIDLSKLKSKAKFDLSLRHDLENICKCD